MILEYQCPKCNKIIEVSHKLDEKCEMCCILCHELFVKIFSATSFVLQGRGFYGRGRI